MVARVIFGQDIDGLVRYNEDKVTQGVAVCMEASGFGAHHSELNTLQKVQRFAAITALNQNVSYNAVHISLNFPPEEQLDAETLQQIANRYMEKIGYGDQPFLLYQHFDAGHPHVHIVTTNIRRDGSKIDTHLFAIKKSAPARLEIEQEFGLIAAKGRGKGEEHMIVPLDPELQNYGERETKAAISNVVRSVIARYKFSSLSEFNAILRQFNVTADPGQPGSQRFENKGLVYSMINAAGEKVGNRIAASRIHDRPTLGRLELMFAHKKMAKEKFRGRLIRVVSDAIKESRNLEEFQLAISRYNVVARFHTNENDYTYGVTFIDNLTKVAFTGNALRKDFSIQSILRKIGGEPTAMERDRRYNAFFVAQVMAATNFSARPQAILARWQRAGLRIVELAGDKGETTYQLGFVMSPPGTFVEASASVSSWIREAAQTVSAKAAQHNRSHRGIADLMTRYAKRVIADGWHRIAMATAAIFEYTYALSYTPHHFKKKKKKKRRRR